MVAIAQPSIAMAPGGVPLLALAFRNPRAKGDPMPLGQRLQALQDRHAALEAKITDEATRPRPDDAELTKMKREKLRLKEEMERLRQAPPDPN